MTVVVNDWNLLPALLDEALSIGSDDQLLEFTQCFDQRFIIHTKMIRQRDHSERV